LKINYGKHHSNWHNVGEEEVVAVAAASTSKPTQISPATHL